MNVCVNCGKNLNIKYRKFCNQSCAASYNNKHRPKKTFDNCLYCGKMLDRSDKEYCSNQCFKDYEYLIYINQQLLNLIDGVKKGGKTSGHIHRQFKEKYNNTCSLCGQGKPNPYINKVILELDHIDGDSGNNKVNNLQLICCNCHTLTPNYKALNKGNANQERLNYHKLKPNKC